jgi:hypothetical protein
MAFQLDPPRDLDAHLAWREELRTRAIKDGERVKRAIRQMCKDDSLWFMEAFCWLFEPRPRKLPDGRTAPNVIPFIAWPHQAPVIKSIEKNLGFCDIGIEKSRAEGASWIVLMEFLRRWLFFPMQQFGLVSRTELACDNSEDPDTPMWKLDWEIQRLPTWLRPAADMITRVTASHTLTNHENGSIIVGYAATGDLARGGRKTAFMMDEIAAEQWRKGGADKAAMESTQHVTDCRILVSTPGGPDGVYYDAMHQDSSMVKLVLDWRDNVSKNRGLYFIDQGEAKPVDVEQYGPLDPACVNAKEWADIKNKLEQRGYRLDDGKSRSPWYDKECLRVGATPKGIAQEVDRDYGGASSRFFDVGLIDKLLKASRPPVTRGEIDFDLSGHVPEWIERLDGRLLLWFKPDVNGRPPATRYIMGIDICMGTAGPKSSSSVITIMRRIDGVIVAQFATPRLVPADLADYAVALAKWFAGPGGEPAFMIWEDNGPGNQFRGRIVDLRWTGYDLIYYRTVAKKITGRKSQMPGWWSTLDLRREALSSFEMALRLGEMKLPSRDTLEEMKGYMNAAGGKVIHVAAAGEEDPSGAGENHGDRVVSAALCNWVRRSEHIPASVLEDHKQAPQVGNPLGSFAWRQEQARRSRVKAKSGW